jgi:hypothetical protein
MKARQRLIPFAVTAVLALILVQLGSPLASATTYPQVAEISENGTIQAGLAPPGVPNWSPSHLAAPLVGIAATPDEGGAWEAAKDGGVFAFGDAQFYGSLPGFHVSPAEPIVGISATHDGGGYWLVGADGGVFAFGDARYYGALPGLGVTPKRPIVGMTGNSDGGGYWLVGADGGVFAFGDARYYGALPGLGVRPVQPIIGIDSPDGGGYWLAGEDGGVFAFGDATFMGSGSAPAPAPVVAIVSWPGTANYTLIQSNELMSTFGPEEPPSSPPTVCPAVLKVIQNPGPTLTAVGGAVIGLAAPTPCSYP